MTRSLTTLAVALFLLGAAGVETRAQQPAAPDLKLGGTTMRDLERRYERFGLEMKSLPEFRASVFGLVDQFAAKGELSSILLPPAAKPKLIPCCLTHQVVQTEEGGVELVKQLKAHQTPIGAELDAALAAAKTSPCNATSLDWMLTLDILDANLSLVQNDTERLAGQIEPSTAASARARADSYDASCLGKLSELPGHLQTARLSDAYAVLLDGGEPVCGALRIAKSVFVTARHCLYRPETGARYSQAGSTRIALISAPTTTYEIRREISNKRLVDRLGAIDSPKFNSQEDYIFLVTETVTTPFVAVSFVQGAIGQPLQILGYYRFHNSARVFSRNKAPHPRKPWTDGLRWTKAPMCRLLDVSDPCRAHLCQTDKVFSGSPVFLDDGTSQLKVVGIHIAHMREPGSCQFTTKTGIGNVAIAYDPTTAAAYLPQD